MSLFTSENHQPGHFTSADDAIASIRAIEKFIPGAVVIHNIKDSTVAYISDWAARKLGATLNEIKQMGAEYHSRFFNPDDAADYVPKILGLLERNNDDEFITYFQQVREAPEHNWGWYLGATKIFYRDAEGQPLLTLTIALPVDAQHHMASKAQRLLDDNSFLRNNAQTFHQLTKREKCVLRMMALGNNSAEMARQLHISVTTANTHRRNIKRKLGIKTSYEITRFAHAFDLL